MAWAVSVAVTLVACGDGDERAASSSSPASTSLKVPPYPQIGTIPEPADPDTGGLNVRRCELTHEGRLVLDATYTNTAPYPVFVGEVAVLLPDDDPDERGPVYSGLVVGPRRRQLIESDTEVDAAAGPCEHVEVDADPERDPNGTPLDPSDVSISGCDAGSEIEVVNATTELIGVAVTVEFYDRDGYSEGRYTYHEWPQSHNGAPPVGGVDPDAVAILDVNMARQVVGCEVVDAVYVTNPEPDAVLSE